MSPPKKKEDTLSVGAKTYIETLARQNIYRYEPIISSKYLEKGTWVEQESINLYNLVTGNVIEKNMERRTNTYLTGEADIVIPKVKGVDIKSAYSLETFPETKRVALKDAEAAGYDWQCAGYMMLWGIEQWDVAYCMVSTPDELLKDWDDRAVHEAHHINPSMLVTQISFFRDKEKEMEICMRCAAAQKYYKEVIEEIKADH
jgi:hypothetical protein